MIELHQKDVSFKVFLDDTQVEIFHTKVHPSGYIELYSKLKLNYKEKYRVNILQEDMWGTSTIIKDKIMFNISTEHNSNYYGILLGTIND